MAKYTEEQKSAVLARIPEIGVSAAAKEAGIPVTTVSKWNKSAKVEEAQVIIDKANAENAEAVSEAINDKKEEIKDKADATIIEAAKKTRETGLKIKGKVKDAKLSVEAKMEDVKDVVAANKIENKKIKAQRSRKVQEKKENAKARLDAAKKPGRKVRAAKVDMIFETNGGRQITPEAIAEKIPKGADAAYIKLEENKIYWVKGGETGAVDIW